MCFINNEIQSVIKKPLVQVHNEWDPIEEIIVGDPTFAGIVKGIGQADSVVWYAHKSFGAPLICSLFLVRDKKS